MKKNISILLVVAMILSLGAVAFADADSQSPDYSTGTPWPDIDLEGVVTEDTPVELKENYALYVNKDAILDLEIPEGYPYGGTIMNLMMLQAEDVKNMFLGEAPASHDARLAHDGLGQQECIGSGSAEGIDRCVGGCLYHR